ncbi:efflux RND transporter periplasmic adaptor subunit [Fontisphaera persica]|uniref:efflux RND transporter periplasmic adaptor subunit n=1 Tax=Fontisphaera persica TaxID=2974023 RepID=UPI0024BFF77E|nr:efflux RND transporter periplasmic adaptor subunit [Fontisphaera persica]WCJ60208.1 efflux RND transporter periplasmic adaptor subunit [Fontisphaera persica]
MKKLLQIVLVLLILAVGLGVSLYLVKTRQKPEPKPARRLPPLVRVQPVQPKQVELTVQSQGVASPRTEVTLAAQVEGRIVAVSPAWVAGGFVEQGEVLVQVEPKDYELALIRAEANVTTAQARLVREEAEAAVARKEWQELQGDKPPPPLLVREPQLAEARAALASAKAAVEEARWQLEKTRVVAPFAGRVLSKSADVGQYVVRGTALGRLQAIDYAEVRLPIPVDQLAFVDLPLLPEGTNSVVNKPRVHLRGVLGGVEYSWTGRVERTESQVDAPTRMWVAVARVEDPYQRRQPGSKHPPLPAGLFVQAEIVGRTVEQVYELPRTALRGESQVLVVKPQMMADTNTAAGGEGVLEIRTVPVVRAAREQALVRGLQPGELVCLSALDAPVNGMRVRIAVEKTSAVPQSRP